MKHIKMDFQGWPVDMLTLEEILRFLGFKENKGSWTISKKNPLLKAYPRLFEDDGMAYGVNPQYITEVDTEIYDAKVNTIEFVPAADSPMGFKEIDVPTDIKVFNVFRESPKGERPTT